MEDVQEGEPVAQQGTYKWDTPTVERKVGVG